ncbi:hypothetical protein Gohar_000120 [Gossypium harknessii]|uniref:RNase H type-1 domain-containing protein n=1 Tax=Gossypium harknessii TaxID=34285 RepID=A0A7J9IBL5_9ROSI|nr:hypothetical protein [Gossypium harknessii]
MNEVDSTWNRELIHNLVDDDTANRIFAIPISEGRPEDINKLIHEGTKFSMPHLLGFIRGYEQDLWLVRENLCVSTTLMRNEVWRPPDYGFIKINFDASFIPGNNFAIIVILARNHKGEVIEAVTYLVEDVDDTFVAEARACERALILVKLKGFRRLIVEGDSLAVIKKLTKNEEDRSIIRPIVHNIHRLRQGFDEVSYQFVNRPLNAVAHTLAVEGRHRKVCGAWVDGLPVTVRSVVEEDWLRWCQRI